MNKATGFSIALGRVDQQRLQRLAAAAKTTPQKMLKFVLRDGFEYCEYVVRETNAGITSMERGDPVYDTAQVMQHIRGLIDKHARRAQKAA